MKIAKAIIAASLAAVFSFCTASCSLESENIVENTISFDSINQITASLSSTDLRINLGNENSVYYKVYESLEPDVSEKDGKLKIVSEKKKSASLNFNTSTYIEVTLNKKQLDDIDLTLSSGDVQINDINVNGNIQTSSGNIKINNVENSNNISLQASSGDISLKKCSFKTLKNKTESGDIYLERINSNNIIIEAKSGDTDIVDTDICNIEANSHSGNVKIKLNGNENDINYDLSANSGSIKVGDSSYEDQYINNNNADKTIKCKTKSGNITVRLS